MHFYRTIPLILLVALASCREEEFDAPRASFDLYYGTTEAPSNRQLLTPTAGDDGTPVVMVYQDSALIMVNTGVGTHFSIWPGDDNNDYFVEGNQGLNFPLDKEVSYTYQEPGTYTLMMWATSLKPDGQEWLRASTTYTVEVLE